MVKTCKPVHFGPKRSLAFLMTLSLSLCLYCFSVDFKSAPFLEGFPRQTFASVRSTTPRPSPLYSFEKMSRTTITTVTSKIVTSPRRVYFTNTTTSSSTVNRTHPSEIVFVNNSATNIWSMSKILSYLDQHRHANLTLFKPALHPTGLNTKTYLDKTRARFMKTKPVTSKKLLHDIATETLAKNTNVRKSNTQPRIHSATEFPTVNEHSHKMKKPKAVIIFTTKRSGSSFVGEFFNRHPDVYYIFEPLHSVADFATRKRMSNVDFLKNGMHVMDGSFHCDFHTENRLRFASEKFCVNNIHLYKNHLCRYGSTRLPPSEAKVKMWERECRKYNMVVVKLIRVNNLEDLEPLMSKIDLEWRIIYLVRDPRPTERSRKESGRNYDLIRRKGTDRNDEVDLCQTLQRNLKYWVDTPSWLRGRFKMIRFEDIAASPLEKAKELLEFLGLDLANDVVKWIRENTEQEKKSTIKQRQFSTSRNTSEVLEAWRHRMDWVTVQKIQKACSVPMESLGYSILPDLDSLRDTNIPSTLPLK